jgi:GH24 family phage-related lysozyme (muramidase)
MPAILRRGDRGDEVSRLQRLLNKVGGLLPEDDAFGPQTEDAVRDAQLMAGLAPTGIADAALTSWLEAQPDPNRVIPTSAIAYIAREEVSSRAAYKTNYHRPVWPGGDSGVTIGIGYDLRMQSAERYEADWRDLLPAADLEALRQCLGRPGSAALADSLNACSVPLAAAWVNFAARVLPRYVDDTRRAFGDAQFDALPPLCRGALVSLVYNRGAQLDEPPPQDRRREMRAIRGHIARGDLARVAGEFRAMKRLWPNTAGLRARRDREADMWERGLGAGA